ncbi:MAG: class I adenylate-forming enzyme family protein [Pseudohongiellaceae bacterium]
MDFVDPLTELLARRSTATALVLVEGRQQRLRWSWQALQQARHAAAGWLREAGVGSGHCLVVQSSNLPHCFALLLAALGEGIALLPIHPDASDDMLQELLARWRPALLIREASLPDKHWLSALRCPLWQLEPGQPRWLQPVSPAVAAAPVGRHPDLALLFHSAGSTGSAKALRYSRRSLAVFLSALAELYAAFPDTCALADGPSARVNILPWTHWGGLSFCLQTLLEGRPLFLLQSSDPRDHLALLQETGAQLLLLVPGLLTELLAVAPGTGALPALKHCLAMGEAVSLGQLHAVQARLSARVYNAYGLSECLTGIYNRHDDLSLPFGSVGRLRFGEAVLLDSTGSPADEGELCVRNATTTPCYTDAALLAARYRDGWFRTGDRLRRDADGYYFYVGRVDSLCVIHGRNVYPREVEAVLLQHPAVRQVVVSALCLRDGRTRLAAAVQLQPGYSLDASELLDFYLRHGAAYATPCWLEFWENLPCNAAGKFDLPRIRDTLQRHYLQSLAAAPPHDG